LWSQLNRGKCFTGSRGFTFPDNFYLGGLFKEPTLSKFAIIGPKHDIIKFLYDLDLKIGLKFAI
tara:strand:- start:482 stop:673 length:192 start_codon:yes stop_codon:yes gene_type:complete